MQYIRLVWSIGLLITGWGIFMLPESCQKDARKLPEMCHVVTIKVPDICQKVARKLPEGRQEVASKLQESCHFIGQEVCSTHPVLLTDPV